MKFKRLILGLFAVLGLMATTSCQAKTNANKIVLMDANDGEADVEYYLYLYGSQIKMIYPHEIEIIDDKLYISNGYGKLDYIMLDNGDFYHKDERGVIYYIYIYTFYKTPSIDETSQELE